MTDTIFAVATGRGKSGLSVIRISGLLSSHILKQFGCGQIEPRRAALRMLKTADGGVIDEALCLWFPEPASFTGEDTVEFHCHGSMSVIGLMLETLSGFDGCRLALPGEFARRAFANGKIDLAAAEGLSDLIDSETERQRQQAIRQYMGGLSREVDQWRTDLIAILALFEADLDFSDEADVDHRVLDSAEERLQTLGTQMQRAVQSSYRGERLRDGLTVVLAGAPNAGKSTLLNVLARRDVAIVSPIPGTTRDIVEVRLDLAGYPVTILDTAGLRETSDAIEQEGVKRMLARAQSADIVLWLRSVLEDAAALPDELAGLKAELIEVTTQIDRSDRVPEGLAISALDGTGIDGLMAELTVRADQLAGAGEEAIVLTRARHREAVLEALDSIERSLTILRSAGTELVVEEVRLAMRAIARVTGHVGVDQVLDHLFSQFCIGK